MLGTLLSLGLGAYAAGSALSDIGRTTEKRNEAVNNKEPFYFDSKGKRRSTKTNEIVTTHAYDPDHDGHTVVVGCTSHKVYEDTTLKRFEEANKQLKEEGKKFYYKEYKNIHIQSNRGGYWQPAFYPFDPEKNLPYNLELLNWYESTQKYPGKMFRKVYLKDHTDGRVHVDMAGTTGRAEYLSLEEAKPWMHGTKRRTF